MALAHIPKKYSGRRGMGAGATQEGPPFAGGSSFCLTNYPLPSSTNPCPFLAITSPTKESSMVSSLPCGWMPYSGLVFLLFLVPPAPPKFHPPLLTFHGGWYTSHYFLGLPGERRPQPCLH